MTADCARLRELAPELVLGLVDGEERGWALDHLGRCADCRRHVGHLAATADDVLLLAPTAEPPAGFEGGVVAAIRAPASAAPTRRRLAALAVAAAASALLGAGAVWLVLGDDRDLASAYRETLEVADGEYLDAAPLESPSGERVGVVFGYEGETPWVLVIAAAAGEGGGSELPAGRYDVELVREGGARIDLPSLEVGDEAASASGALPAPYEELRELRVLTAAGEEAAEAKLGSHD